LGWSGPQYNGASPDTSAMTVLAALAHELGHVRWYDTFVKIPGSGNYDFKKLCGGSFFDSWDGSWQRVHGPPGWRNFQTPAERKNHPGRDKHRIDLVQVTEIDSVIPSNLQQAALLLGPGPAGTPGIYAPSAPWASFFGAVSPDEDFVETYKFYALTTAVDPNTSLPNPLTSLPLRIPYVGKEDIPSDYAAGFKQDLSTKTQCIANLPPPPSSPRFR
jgi:hypothetical protein